MLVVSRSIGHAYKDHRQPPTDRDRKRIMICWVLWYPRTYTMSRQRQPLSRALARLEDALSCAAYSSSHLLCIQPPTVCIQPAVGLCACCITVTALLCVDARACGKPFASCRAFRGPPRCYWGHNSSCAASPISNASSSSAKHGQHHLRKELFRPTEIIKGEKALFGPSRVTAPLARPRK